MINQVSQKHYSDMKLALEAYQAKCSTITQQAKYDIQQAAGDRESQQQAIDTQKQQLENAYEELKHTIDSSQKSFFADVENIAKSQDEANLASMEKLLNEA